MRGQVGAEAGFSLIETLVAIAILGLAVVAISFVPSLTLGRSNESRTYAVNVARQVMDTYRSQWQKRSDFVAGSAPSLPTGLRFGCTVPPPSVTPLAFDSNFQLVATGGEPQVRRVQVSVTCQRLSPVSFTSEIGDPLPSSDVGGS